MLHLGGDTFGLIQSAVEQVYFFLTLFQEIAGSFDFFVCIDRREFSGDMAHLCRNFEKGGL